LITIRWILERWGGVDWIGLAYDRDKWRDFTNMVMNLQAGNLLSDYTTDGVSSSGQLHRVNKLFHNSKIIFSTS
jgi:hypothetical protein